MQLVVFPRPEHTHPKGRTVFLAIHSYLRAFTTNGVLFTLAKVLHSLLWVGYLISHAYPVVVYLFIGLHILDSPRPLIVSVIFYPDDAHFRVTLVGGYGTSCLNSHKLGLEL